MPVESSAGANDGSVIVPVRLPRLASVSFVLATQIPSDAPDVGELVRVRGQQWVVSSCNTSTQPRDELAANQPPGRTLVTLVSVSDEDLGEDLTLVWEVEPGREVLPATQLPQVT